MNWIKSIFLKNNSDQSRNEECSEIKHSINALKSNNISNDNNINDLNNNSVNNDNMEGQNNCTYSTESFLKEFQKYLENYYEQQNKNNTSDIDKKPTISRNKLKHEHKIINDDIVNDFSNALENGNTFKITHEVDESIIHQDILNNINTDVKSCHQQDDFIKENKQFGLSIDNFNDKFSISEQYLATGDVIYNSCDILNSQEIFENTIDLEFEYNNKSVNDTDIEEFIIDKHSGDVRSHNNTIIPFIDQNEVPTTENMNGCQEMFLDIQNLKETIAIDYGEKNTTTFNIHTINDDEISKHKLSGPFNHNKTFNFSESFMGAMTNDMFDAKSISINFDDNNGVHKNKYKTDLDIEDLSELNYGSSTPRKEATNSINLDNITAIPLEIETKDDKETKMKNKCGYIEEISIEDNDKSILNFQNSKKIPAKTDQITNNYNTLNKIKTSMNNELSMDVIIDLTDEQDEILSDSDDSDNGSYNSSDFEFIKENEAVLNGLYFAEKKVASSVIAKPNHDFRSENIMAGYFDDPVAQSRQHSIPIGHSYYELFQGRYTPYPMRGMQNKCIGPKGSVGEGYRGVGFDVPRVEPEILPFDLRREASECVNKIYNMYPVENRRRRRSTRNR